MAVRSNYIRTYPTSPCNTAKISSPYLNSFENVIYHTGGNSLFVYRLDLRVVQHSWESPKEITSFCESLDLPVIELPDWYNDLRLPRLRLKSNRTKDAPMLPEDAALLLRFHFHQRTVALLEKTVSQPPQLIAEWDSSNDFIHQDNQVTAAAPHKNISLTYTDRINSVQASPWTTWHPGCVFSGLGFFSVDRPKLPLAI